MDSKRPPWLRPYVLGAALIGCGGPVDPAEADPSGADGGGGSGGSRVGSTEHCPVDTGYAGDDACLPLPLPGEGIQIHVGPADYDDPDAVAPFLMPVGRESSECWSLHTPNDAELYYQTSEISGRPGTHHIINTVFRTEHAAGGFTACRDPGAGTSGDFLTNLPGASRPYMPRSTVAPENQGLGKPLPARAPMQADMHYFNFTTEPIVREFWMNLYTLDESEVTEEPLQIRGMGGYSWLYNPIPPNSHDVYAYSCPITEDGRIVQLLGHTHAHGIRETAWVRRESGERIQVFEQYDYLEPQLFQYDTITENPPFSSHSPGALTGPLLVYAGDTLEWECEVHNDSAVPLTYTNNVETGEMCNLWGQSVGPLINCVLP
jgi:hypothetical protein